MSVSQGGKPARVTEVVFGQWEGRDQLGAAVPPALLPLVTDEPQKAFPVIAKDRDACAQIRAAVEAVSTRHILRNLDSRELELEDESVDLVLTSPPYWTLKKYNDHDRQLGDVADYDEFLDDLDEVWHRAYRALVP